MDRAEQISAEQHTAFFQRKIAAEPQLWFAIEARSNERLAGGIWLWDVHPRHRRAEVRLFVDPKSGGKGYGTEAILLCSRYAFETLHLHKLYAYVHHGNTASERAFLRAGYLREAVLRDEAVRDGHYNDVTRFALVAPA